MDELYAPWRMEWVQRGNPDAEFDDCVFCALPQQNDDATHRIFARSKHAYAVLNNAPYCPGHTLVVPCEHFGTYADLDEETLVDLSKLQQKTTEAVRLSLSPDGMNVGMNLGKAGGASVVDHLHVHVVPRWEADTTFMPVISDAKVLPEALNDTYNRLHESIAALDGVSDSGNGNAVTVVSND